MPGDVDYAFEKYWASLSSMAEMDGTVAERLIGAFQDQGHRTHPLMPGLGPAISDETAARMEAFYERISGRDATGKEGTIAATIMAMDDVELDSAVSEFVSITYALAEEYFTHHGHA